MGYLRCAPDTHCLQRMLELESSSSSARHRRRRPRTARRTATPYTSDHYAPPCSHLVIDKTSRLLLVSRTSSSGMVPAAVAPLCQRLSLGQARNPGDE